MENSIIALDEKSKIFLYIGISIYLCAILLVGYIAGKRVKGMGDFLVAGRRLPLWMATATLLATWFGAGSSMGVASTVYKDGIGAVIADPFAAAISLILAGLFIVGRLRHLKLLTVTEIIERQFGRWAGVYASCWMIPVYVGWLGAQILGIGSILNMLIGLDIFYGALIGAVIVLIYTIAGGMWAVTLTDVVQVSLIVIGLFMIIPGAISQSGGINAVFENIPKGHLSLLPQESGFNNTVYYIGQWCVMGLGCMVGQDLVQRSLSSRTERIAVSSALLAGLGYLMIAIVPLSIGFSARLLFPELTESQAEYVLPLMASKVMHPIVFTIFLSALISAIMSSADSSLLAASSLITNNIVKPFKPDLSEIQFLHLTRLMTLLITVIAFITALYVQSIYSLMINCWASQLVVVFFPVVAALYIPKSKALDCWIGMLSSTLIWVGYVLWQWSRSDALDFNLDFALTCGAVYGFAAGVAAFGISYFSRKKNDDTLLVEIGS